MNVTKNTDLKITNTFESATKLQSSRAKFFKTYKAFIPKTYTGVVILSTVD